MPQFSKRKVAETTKSASFAFNYVAPTSLAHAQLTGGIVFSDLAFALTGSTGCRVDITKLIWSLPISAISATGPGIAVNWDSPGGATFGHVLYGVGETDFKALGFPLANPFTGANRINSISFSSLGEVATNQGLSIFIEISKTLGFGFTGA